MTIEQPQTKDGDAPAFIPYGRQWIDEEDIEAVVQVLRSSWITQGPKIREFEEAFARHVHARFAVAVNSGTAALHVACLAAGLGPGDEIVTSPITFVATANCALYVGARPAFVDIDPTTFNLDPGKLEAYLEEKAFSRQGGQRARPAEPCPRAVIPVHFGGLPCDMAEIRRIADRFQLVVIEDACHALGAAYRGQGRGREEQWVEVGSCAHSHMTVFSFHPVKHITTGEGGMITTNDSSLYERLCLFRNHGITRDPDKLGRHVSSGTAGNEIPDRTKTSARAWYYETQALGFNYRMTDIQSALGLSQLKKTESFVHRRRFIAGQYAERLRGLSGFRPQRKSEGCRSSYHLYVICVDPQTGIGRDELMDQLKKKGVGTQVHYVPVYTHPLYRELGFSDGCCPNAESYFRQCVSIPIYPAMSQADIDRVVEALEMVGGDRR